MVVTEKQKLELNSSCLRDSTMLIWKINCLKRKTEWVYRHPKAGSNREESKRR